MVATNVTLEVEGLSGTLYIQHAERLERNFAKTTLLKGDGYSELEHI